MAADYQTADDCLCDDERLAALCERIAAEHAARTPEQAWQITRGALERWAARDREAARPPAARAARARVA
jgi:hypothetical protein